MRNPGKAASGSGFGDDTGYRCLAFRLQSGSGRVPWSVLRVSPAFGKASPDPCGCDFFSGGGLGVGLHLLCRLPGRYPDGLLAGHGSRYFAVGGYRRAVAPAGIFRILGFLRGSAWYFADSLEKNFGNCKNFVCIWGKMGYNRVYENFQFRQKAEEEIPWQKNRPRGRP